MFKSDSKSKLSTISNEELQQLAELLTRLLKEYRNDLTQVDKQLSHFSNRRIEHPDISSNATSFRRYIADIATYLKTQGLSLITPYPDDWIEKYRTKPGKKEGDLQGRNLLKKNWLKGYLLDLMDCFFEVKQTESSQLELKKPQPYCTFNVYFWHWLRRTKREKELLGQVMEGNLTIIGNWITARFSYQTPDGRAIAYEGPIELRNETISGTHGATENHRTYYLSLSETTDRPGEADKLMVVFTVQNNHADNTVLTGTFTSADLAQGYPAMGRIFLIADELLKLPEDALPEKQQEVQSLISFARTYVAYQTRLLRPSSFATLDEIPGFLLWRESVALFSQPLHGYFFKAIQRDDPADAERDMVHFMLKVNAVVNSDQPSQAIIEYDNPQTNPTNKGYLQVEATEGHGRRVFRGEFDFMPEQNRFRFQILFAKSPDSEWYFGAIMGQNRNRQKLLLGRFALRKDPLDSKWLASDKIGELLQYDRALANFLLEVSQHIPTETLPLYQHIGWPHLPRPHHTPEELHFARELAGDYICFALIRKNHRNDNYRIAGYPLKIHPDGRLIMKFEKRKKPDESEYTIEYYGRAFNNTGTDRLFLYFDSRREGNDKKTFHLSMYFKVQPSSSITTAFGVSSRFAHTEDMPEARMEVLVSLKDIDLEKIKLKEYDIYREYDPFLEKDLTDLKEIEPGLPFYLAGRLNRLVLPNSKLRPNREIPTRQDPFRTLHIKAALYEIMNRYGKVSDCISLLKESYRHGYGTEKNDIRELQNKINDESFRIFFNKRKPAEQKEIRDELAALWGVTIELLPAK
ncbi:hypothetical protein WBJ53_09525 [Spirosoma sp. SC4-14]|uniref:hypothetical protein n=1 Tax=Spirosoma sp. SC4-14 TaxID=3128900 RepID=UPI0030D341C1